VSSSDFSLDDIKERFNLHLDGQQDLYSSIPPVEISALLRDTVAESVPLALAN
jgi:hypothetical protein